jgi:hypothetical protein
MPEEIVLDGTLFSGVIADRASLKIGIILASSRDARAHERQEMRQQGKSAG